MFASRHDVPASSLAVAGAAAGTQTTATANAKKSAVRARVEHVFAHQKDRMGLFVRTIGLSKAEAKIGLANLAYNLQRFLFHQRRAATG
jgi:hypothetical protein